MVRRHNPTPYRAMDFLFALTGVAARFGMTAGAHHRYSRLHEQVSQRGRLTRAQNDPHLRESNAQSAHQVNEVSITHWKVRAKFSSRRTKTRHAYGQRRLPATLEQVFQMRSTRDC